MDNRFSIVAYEVPEVLGSFDARDILGSADGLAGGSTITSY